MTRAENLIVGNVNLEIGTVSAGEIPIIRRLGFGIVPWQQPPVDSVVPAVFNATTFYQQR